MNAKGEAGVQPMDEAGAALTNAMMARLISLASGSGPDVPGAVAWPLFDEGENYLVIDRALQIGSHWNQAACDFWDAAQGSP